MDDEKIRAAYRATLVAALKEAESKGDKAAQQRIRLMIDLHDRMVSLDDFNIDGIVKDSGS